VLDLIDSMVVDDWMAGGASPCRPRPRGTACDAACNEPTHVVRPQDLHHMTRNSCAMSRAEHVPRTVAEYVLADA